jgi:PD-(D/E)XK nuclease superfamily protein
MVEGGHKIWRVQVKTCGTLKDGLFRVNIRCKTNRIGHAYAESEVDVVAVYIMLEETWYVVPIRAVAGRTTLLFRAKGSISPDIYARYREAWHLLGEPASLAF